MSRPRPSLRALGAAGTSFALGLALVLSIGAGAGPASAAGAPAVSLDHLQANGRTNPLGIPGDAPSLSWHAESAARGVAQTAYQVRVASTAADLSSPDVWDSGQVDSDRQVDVPYGGPALTSQTRYYWQVRTWDGDATPSDWSAPSFFETGLLSASDWVGSWITDDANASLNKWADYTTTVDFHLDKLAFGVYFRAADTNDAYMWQLTVSDGTPRLKVHKLSGGNFNVVENKDISSFITTDQLLAGDHTLAINADGGTLTTSLDGTQIDQRTDNSFAKGYVGLRTSHDPDGSPEVVTVHSVDVTAKTGSTLLHTDFANGDNPFSAGTVANGDLTMSGDLNAWYAPQHPLPLLRDQFTTEPGKTIASARVFASARGVYQLSINGRQVGDSHLAPGSTNYNKRIQSQEYDVTDLLTSGDNAIGAELGSGWYSGRDFWLQPGYFGTDTSLIAQLRIDYTDGTHQVVATDPSWTTHSGPFVLADNIDGESYDARLTQPGFDTTGFDASDWSPATVAADTTDKLVPQPDEPVRTSQELPALVRTENPTGSFIYDLGQNMVGVSQVTISGHAGDTVRIRYGEVLNPDGSLYTANLRSAKATDHYTFATDGTVTYTPTFTFHGFRYIEITGASTAPGLSDVTGEVWGSDLAATGTLHTSDPMLNQLVSNISWGQRGNFLSIPTDTPARDERLGWLGDINVFSPTAAYLRDTRAFMEKFSADLRDSQQPSGALPGVAPDYGSTCCGGGTAWEDAMITVPYAVFEAYGDTDLVQQNYAAMQKFFYHVQASAGPDLIDSDRNVYGDWLNLGDDTPAGVIGTAYYAEDARMLSEMAASIGQDADAAMYAQVSHDVRAAFADTFVQPDGTVGSGSQTGYALALGMDLVPQGERDAVGAKFVAKVHASNDHLTTGFVGTPWLLPALTSIGQDALAYQLLETKTFPSWGYEISKGATTMWERWDSINPDGSFGDVSMNSFNHYAYGAVGSWMYQNIGGIAPAAAGYKQIRIAPAIGGGLTHGQGSYDSAYGTIATNWNLTGGDLSLHVDVPVNTTADVVIPADSAYAVTEGGHLLDGVDGITDVSSDGGQVTVSVGSGGYDFAITATNTRLAAVLDSLDALSAHVADLADQGDLTTDERSHLDDAIGTAHDDVSAALVAATAGDDATEIGTLEDALGTVTALRTWLAGSSVDAPVRGDLDRRLGTVENQIEHALTAALGVTVTLPPVATPVLPRGTVNGTVEVANTGDSALTALHGAVTVGDWGSADLSLGSVPAGGDAQIPVSVKVPPHQAPGSYDASLTLSLTRGTQTFTLTDTTPGWVTVTSGASLGVPTWEQTGPEPVRHALLHVPVTNNGDAALRGSVQATLPAGWKSVPSARITVPPGQTVTADVPVVVPLDMVGGPVATTLTLRDAGVTLATADASPSFDLVTPPPADAVVDHVDFGDTTSETAHALQASPSSGTNVEAGLTRRYANSGNPGAWYSVQLDVPPGQPFVLRDIETFDGARTKKYNVYVDGTLVKTQLVPRTETGQGTKTYDALIDDPAVLEGDGGSVRVKFEYPLDASGFFDPSIADLWVLGVGDDAQAPDVAATVASATVGDNGWYRSDAQVQVDAVDDTDPAPHVQTGTDNGWQDYVGPVTVSGDGKHVLSYRATDATGNTSGARALPVWIDGTAPSTVLGVTSEPGAGTASLTFAATDALSGVAGTTYRIDGGDWQTAGSDPVQVSGFGDHTVDYASTDRAGNPEPMRHTTLTLSDVDTITALATPQVSGSPTVGAHLHSTTGVWNTQGLAFTRHWLRDGTRITGATGTSYTVRGADLGHRLSVRVTASKPGLKRASSTSTETARVTRAPSTATVTVGRTEVTDGASVPVTAAVTAPVIATGRVKVLVDGKVVARPLLHDGVASATVHLHGRGRHVVLVRYPGSATVAPSTSPKVRLRVT
jgi:alpha-L-rhamnosidase